MLPLIENAPIKPQINTITNFFVEMKFERRPAGEWHTAAHKNPFKSPCTSDIYNTPHSGGSVYYM